MANPQPEDGYTSVVNEIAEALCKIHLSPSESRVLWTILRKTYGWHKKMDCISYTQFEEATGMDRWHIAPVLKSLISRNIIICINPGPKKICEYGLQKDYEKWSETITKTGNKSITENGNKLLPEQVIDGENELLPKTVTTITETGNSSGEKSITGSGETITTFGESITKTGNKSITGLRETQKKETITKTITKATTARGIKISDEYLQDCQRRFPDLDVADEWRRCQLWWAEGKKVMKKPMSALENWLTKSRQIKRQEAQGGQNKRSTETSKPGGYGIIPRDKYTPSPEYPDLQ